MLTIGIFGLISIIIGIIIIFICCIGILFASRFQDEQEKKYKDCVNLVNSKGTANSQISDVLSDAEISKIDSSINVVGLMKSLYDTYIKLENKVKKLDDNFDDVLVGYIKKLYISKIDLFKSTNHIEVIDDIELLNYCIIDFSPKRLKFRVSISCFNYKKQGEEIVSGSNLEKISQVLVITYEKINNEWLISDIERAYEKKLNS